MTAPSSPGPGTTPQHVLDGLRREIVTGALRPGTRVAQDEVSRRLGVSLAPVREALRVLEQEGQVTYIARRGYFVTELRIEDLEEIYELRRVLEERLARHALPTLDELALQRIELAAKDCVDAAQVADVTAELEANRRFHFAILEAPDRPHAMRLIRLLWESTEAYRAMYYGDVDERRATIGAHDRIVEAVRSRDADLLVAELDAHRQRALDVLRDVLDTDNPSARKVNMTDNGRIEILEEVVEGFNRHDLDAIMAHFADDCEFDSSRGPERWGRRFTGKDEVRKGLGALFESTPDVHFGDDRHFVSGNRGLSEWTITGTTADGDRIDLRGCDLWTFDDDGKIVRKDSFMKRPVDTTTGR